MTAADVVSQVDHLIYATANLERGIAEIEALLGVRPMPGGKHPAWGTRNALVALGPSSYLEIIAPDPDHVPSSGVYPFGLGTLQRSRLVGWAAKGTQLEKLRESAARHGVELGNVLAGSRQLPGGALLTWQITDLHRVVADGVVPFFIDWGESLHPAKGAPPGATLADLRAEHPDAGRVRGSLGALELNFPVAVGPTPALLAQVDCPRGRVVLR
jgi:hypothetical protein